MKKNNNGYSTIIALLLVGFMIIVTTGVFNLIFGEWKDTKAMSSYLRAYAGAEAGIELGLLDMKYSVEDLKGVNENMPKSDILGNKDKVTYFFDAYTSEIKNRTIRAGDYALIDMLKAFTPTLKLSSQEVLWNFVGAEAGITGKGDITNGGGNGTKKTLGSDNKFIYTSQTAETFLKSSEDNYLVLYNPTNQNETFSLNVGASNRFLKDVVGIKSSGYSGRNYKQNLVLNVDTTGSRNFLKYSIFSL